MCDNRPCAYYGSVAAYYGSVADSHPWQHRNVGAQPGILSNRDRTVVEDALQPFYRVNRMIGADQAAPRAYQGAMANGEKAITSGSRRLNCSPLSAFSSSVIISYYLVAFRAFA